MSMKIIRINLVDKKVLGFRLINKKHNLQNIDKTFDGKPIKMSWFTKKLKKFIEKLYPDFHVDTKAQFIARMERNHNSEMEGLQISSQSIRFYDEDMEKLNNMKNQDERIEFLRKLRREKRYIVEE